jgi:hypothetical protein
MRVPVAVQGHAWWWVVRRAAVALPRLLLAALVRAGGIIFAAGAGAVPEQLVAELHEVLYPAAVVVEARLGGDRPEQRAAAAREMRVAVDVEEARADDREVVLAVLGRQVQQLE